MICNSCGKEIEDTNTFCGYCGNRYSENVNLKLTNVSSPTRLLLGQEHHIHEISLSRQLLWMSIMVLASQLLPLFKINEFRILFEVLQIHNEISVTLIVLSAFVMIILIRISLILTIPLYRRVIFWIATLSILIFISTLIRIL